MLYPKLYYTSIYDVDYGMLKSQGISAVIFDVDNTLVPFDVPVPSASILELFERLRQMGFKIGLLSNNGESRLRVFNESIGVAYICRARKPGVKGLAKLLKTLDVKACQTALIGDQIFTDVICANRFGVLSVLVRPASEMDEISVKWKRGFEKIVIARYEKHCKKARKHV